MKPTFHHRPVNGPFDDPCLYVRLLRERRALLFDAGRLDGLDLGDVLKVSDLFVTHTHIDHFIGFDTLLRALLGRPGPLRVFGPEGITDHVQGKLGGYTWNLITDYPLGIEVSEIDGKIVKRSSFRAEHGFRKTPVDERSFDGTALRDSAFTVRAALLSHAIPCLAYSIEEEFHININKDALLRLGLPVGPWLNLFKKAIREGAPADTAIDVEGQAIPLGRLKDIHSMTRGQKVTYITDVSPEEENVRKAVELSRGSETLYCEAYFLDEDMERARDRNHLTARLAGRIAREAGVNNLVTIHYSPKYRRTPHVLDDEAQAEFRKIH